MNTLLLIPYEDLPSFMNTEHQTWEPGDREAFLKDAINNKTQYQVCARLGILTNDEIDSIKKNGGAIKQTGRRSPKKNSRPKAITDVDPKKTRKMLKDTMVNIFDQYVHMTITKDEANIWRFFDTFKDQDAFETFTNNMTKYLKACRIKKIQYHSADGNGIKTSNIDDYISELLDTNDTDELVLILGSIDESQLGDIRMETRLLINNARQKVTASIN
jgi:hypothetical protein